MKKITLVTAFAFIAGSAFAQNPDALKFPPLDASPMDAAYYPVNATKVKKEDRSTPAIRVLYSRPSKKGREVFGVLEQFDKVWRLGANENTEIAFNQNVTMGEKKIKAGRYGLFAIPSKDHWTIIINKQTDRWGAFNYDAADDVARMEVPVSKLDKAIESLSIVFSDRPEGANMVIAWDTTQVVVPFTFKK